MDRSLINKVLNEDSYNEYIDNNNCLIKLSIVNQNGEKEEFNDKTFKCDEVFYKDFLNILIKRFNEEIEVVTKDIVNLDDDSLVTLRLLTKNNDLFSVDGLREDRANYLLSLIDDDFKYTLLLEDEMGIGNLKIFTLIILILIIVAIFFIFNKSVLVRIGLLTRRTLQFSGVSSSTLPSVPI